MGVVFGVRCWGATEVRYYHQTKNDRVTGKIIPAARQRTSPVRGIDSSIGAGLMVGASPRCPRLRPRDARTGPPLRRPRSRRPAGFQSGVVLQFHGHSWEGLTLSGSFRRPESAPPPTLRPPGSHRSRPACSPPRRGTPAGRHSPGGGVLRGVAAAAPQAGPRSGG
jgi:hypothetical protein